jgi:hypothetical protein
MGQSMARKTNLRFSKLSDDFQRRKYFGFISVTTLFHLKYLGTNLLNLFLLNMLRYLLIGVIFFDLRDFLCFARFHISLSSYF